MMCYILAGNTIVRGGRRSRRHTLAGATLIFYRCGEEKAGSRFPRWSWTPMAEAGLAAEEIGRTAVRDDGTYEVTLDAYQGGGLRVALAIEKLAYAPASGKSAFGLLGDVQPIRSPRTPHQDLPSATLNIGLSKTAFCALLKDLDLVLVAGRVTHRARGKRGSGARLRSPSHPGSSPPVGFAPGWPSETSDEKPRDSDVAVGFAPGWPLPQDVPPSPAPVPEKKRKLA